MPAKFPFHRCITRLCNLILGWYFLQKPNQHIWMNYPVCIVSEIDFFLAVCCETVLIFLWKPYIISLTTYKFRFNSNFFHIVMHIRFARHLYGINSKIIVWLVLLVSLWKGGWIYSKYLFSTYVIHSNSYINTYSMYIQKIIPFPFHKHSKLTFSLNYLAFKLSITHLGRLIMKRCMYT